MKICLKTIMSFKSTIILDLKAIIIIQVTNILGLKNTFNHKKNMIKIINNKLKLNIHTKLKIKKKNIEIVKTGNFFKPKPFGYYL